MLASWHADTPNDPEELRLYAESWCSRYALIEGFDSENYKQNARERLKVHYNFYHDLYRSLDTLDNKSGALMQAPSIIFATLSFTLERVTRDLSLTLSNALVTTSTMLALTSVVLCISVLWVKWIQVRHFQDEDYTNAMVEVLKLRSSRTNRYRMAHTALLLSITLVAISAALKLSGVG
jgi:hypothetical protein